MSLHLTDYNAPPEPDADATPVELIEYDLHFREWKAFGHWMHEVFVPKKDFAKIMNAYKAAKMLDPKAKLIETHVLLVLDGSRSL